MKVRRPFASTASREHPPGSRSRTAFMDAVFTTGSELGWREYFSVSDTAQYDNHAFEIEIASSGRVLAAGEH